ncbi:YceG family protein [Pseudobacillus badius]|uniref:YceG family protein n=1 Tax=Bacillus badius TaxID=1455 RepID=UPI000ACAD809|nr:YceG family protein [Bacillus badius]TDW02576.1 YceG-like Ter operon protein [Bacillus badius]
MKRKPIFMQVDYTNWMEELAKPITSRPQYHQEESEVQYSRIAARVLGAGFDETEYLLALYSLSEQPHVCLLSETLDKTMPNDRFQSIQRIHHIIQEEPQLSINRFVAFLEGAELLPKYKEDPDFNRLVRSALIEVFALFQANHGGALGHPEFRRVFLDMIKWIWNHLDPWVKEIPLAQDVPHIVWYGDMSKSQAYFLYYLILLGMDVVILHPEGKDDFKEIDPKNEWTVQAAYPSTMKLQPFPTEEPKRQGTVAYRASKEIEHVLNHEGSAFYKPWQFRNHLPVSVILKTTYDEVFLLAKEKAFIRPGFAVEGEEVKVPNLFAKISGVSKNRKDYWEKMHKLTSGPNAVTITSFPYRKESKANNQFHYRHALGKDGQLDPSKMLESNWWQYGQLHDGLQLGIAAAISRMCADPKIKPLSGESEEDVRLYLFTQTITMPEEILNVLQTFDYSQDVPKIILYNNEKNGDLSRADAAFLLLLSEFGLDIILYNPPGHNDLERFIDKQYFDHHLLEDMVFDLPFDSGKKDFSILSRIFKQIF